MNTRIELLALRVKYRTLRDEATFRHISYRNTLRSNYYKDLGIQENLYIEARNVLNLEIKRLHDAVTIGGNDHLQQELELVKGRRKSLASDFEERRHLLKSKLKDSIAISSLEERNELTEIQSNYLQQRFAILSNSQMKGGEQ